MHDVHPRHPQASNEATRLVLREAKRLHKAAADESLAVSLPVLRRLLATGTLLGLSLPQLHRHKHIVQRKHVLRMMAMEAGFSSWEAYRPALALMEPAQLPHFEIARQGAAQLNAWFSSLAEAQAHAAQHGGRALRVGGQAVVLG